MSRRRIFYVFVAGAACVFFVWEAFARSSSTLHFVLPAPSAILSCLAERFDRFSYHSFITVKEMVAGFFFAVLVSFPLGLAMAASREVRSLLQPFFVALQCMPIFALAPIMILWFGWSNAAIVTTTALMIFFPLTLNIYKGLAMTPKHLVDYFKMSGATPWQTFYKLKLPWAAPHIFSGVRISAAVAGIAVVAGEWAGAEEGLGVLLIESRRAADLEMAFGALFCLSLLTLLFYAAAIAMENRASSRRPIKFRKGRGIFVGLIMCAFLAGCQNASNKEKPVRMILDWFPNPNHVPLFAGIGKGVFERHGVPLQLITHLEPGDALPFVNSGQAELFVWYMPSVIRAREKGEAVEPVGLLIEKPLNCFLFRKDSGIAKPQDLTGKVMGYCSDGTERKYLNAILEESGIFPSRLSNVNVDIVATLATGKADAVWGAYWNIEGAHLATLGLDTGYFSMGELGVPEHYELLVFCKGGSRQSDKNFVSAFQEALQESIDFCLKNPEEAFFIYARANPDKSEKTLLWEKKAWENTQHALPRRQKIEPAVWARFREWMDEKGFLH